MVGRKKSPAWKVFKKVTKRYKTYVICGLCETELSYSKDCSTGTMNKHLKAKHPVKYEELYKEGEPCRCSISTLEPTQSASTSGLESILNSKKSSSHRIESLNDLFPVYCFTSTPIYRLASSRQTRLANLFIPIHQCSSMRGLTLSALLPTVITAGRCLCINSTTLTCRRNKTHS